jgi:hypothetical protein
LGVLVVAWVAIHGLESWRIARQQRRSPAAWFIYGGVLGPIGLRILREAPPGTCGSCLSPVEGWSFLCPYCGADVRESAQGMLEATAQTRSVVASPSPGGMSLAAPTVARRLRVAIGAASGTSANRTGTQRPQHLASAVFVEGSEPLQPGTRYQLAIHGEDLRITGLINTLPDRKIVSRRLGELKVSSAGDQLVITGATTRLAGFRVVFSGLQDETHTMLTVDADAVIPRRDLDSPAAAR